MEQVADGVYRLGSSWVNFYLVEEGGALTVVDTGMLGYVDQFAPALAELDKAPSDVKAIVVTHSHSDHVGGIAEFARTTGAPVFAPAGEIGMVTGDAKPVPPRGVLRALFHLTMFKFLGHYLWNKGLAKVTVPDATAFEPDAVLDVPGKLRAIATPGHSSAHSSLLLESRRILFSGDALATLAVNTGETGPMLHPLNKDRAAAALSLSLLEPVDADLILPGHGRPWRGLPADAVAAARARL